MSHKYKAAILGASGFLGNALSQRLNTRKQTDLITVSRKTIQPFQYLRTLNVTDYTQIPRNLAKYAIVLLGPNSSLNNVENIITNTLKTILDKNFEKIIYASSALLYNQTGKEIKSETSDLLVSSPYQSGKLQCEHMLYSNNKNIILRFGNIYGTGMSESTLFSDIKKQILNNDTDKIILKKSHPIRDYIHINDVTDLLEKLLNTDIPGGIYNVGTGTGYAVNNIVDMAQKIEGTSKTSAYVTNSMEIDSIILSNEKIESALSWKPKTPLQLGLRGYIRNEKIT